MRLTRRTLISAAIAAPAVIRIGGRASAATTLKISHQFPGGTIDAGDFRDRLVRRFAADVTAKTGGALQFEFYPNSSLMKTNAQFSALRKGALDFSLYPLSYAGGEVPEVNIGLMPSLVSSYAQGLAWKTQPVGTELTNLLADKGVLIITWIWQAGGVASRDRPLLTPEDAKGQKVRGGSKEMDMVLKTAGAAVLSIPSNELYAAMQTGACDAGITSSTSLISFRLDELSKHLATGNGKSFWFMFEPLLMSKQVFDGLPKDQQAAIVAAGQAQEAFGLEGAKADDIEVEKVFAKAGAKVSKFDDAVLAKWREIARATAWKDYAERTPLSAKLLQLAEQVTA